MFVVNSRQPETLARFVQRIRNNKRLSVSEVSRRSGKRISASYVNKLENQPNVHPSLEKLQALAKGLGVSEEEILAIASGKELSEEIVMDNGLPRNFHKLSPEKQNIARIQISAIIDALVDTEPKFDYIDEEQK